MLELRETCKMETWLKILLITIVCGALQYVVKGLGVFVLIVCLIAMYIKSKNDKRESITD